MERRYFEEYYFHERNHWWFKVRLLILNDLIRYHVFNKKPLKILNAGAATGATSLMLKDFGYVTSLEYDKDCAVFLSSLLNDEVVNASLTDLPFSDNSIDLVCAFDVIEHIEDDHKALTEIFRTLKPDGMLFLTVPAFEMLWSNHDVINMHYRRYTAKALRKLVSDVGFEIKFESYFNFILFIPVLLYRSIVKFLFFKNKYNNSGSDFEVFKSNEFSNSFFYRLFSLERFFLSRGVRFPFGVSLAIIVRKPKS
jgi:SAM-dependent methyltransferase